MNPFANMTPEMIALHNARVAKRRSEYAKGNPFSEPAQPVHATETGKQGEERESKVRAEILAFCAKQWPVWITSTTRTDRKSTIAKGFADLVVFGPFPSVWIIELKRVGGKLSPEQRAFAAQMKHLGWTVHVVYSFWEFEKIIADGDCFIMDADSVTRVCDEQVDNFCASLAGQSL